MIADQGSVIYLYMIHRCRNIYSRHSLLISAFAMCDNHLITIPFISRIITLDDTVTFHFPELITQKPTGIE